jgi:hypothetical protein
MQDRLFGLVVRVPGYKSRSLGSIPGATRFLWEVVGLEQGHSVSWVQLRSYLKEKVASPVKKIENTAVGIRCADHATPSIRKRWH